MTHKNVREAFEMYRRVCHDASAQLRIENPRDGASRYSIVNGKFKMHAMGAKQAVRYIEIFADGYVNANIDARGAV